MSVDIQVFWLFFLLTLYFSKHHLPQFLQRAVYFPRLYRSNCDGTLDRERIATAAIEDDEAANARAIKYLFLLLTQPYSEEELTYGLNFVDLEAYLFLRMLRMCMSLSVVASILVTPSLCVLYSKYSESGNTFDRWTSSYVPKGNHFYWWGAAFGVFILVIQTLRLAWAEGERFAQARARKATDPSRASSEYSCFIDRIPAKVASSDAKLAKYFDKIFPGQVFSARVCQVIAPELEEILQRRDDAVKNLEITAAAVGVWRINDPRLALQVETLERLNQQVDICLKGVGNDLDDLVDEEEAKGTGTVGIPRASIASTIDDTDMKNTQQKSTESSGLMASASKQFASASKAISKTISDVDLSFQSEAALLQQQLQSAGQAMRTTFSHLIVGLKSSSSGFVTFRSLKTALVARSTARVATLGKELSFEVYELAPQANDVVWANISEDASSVSARSKLFSLLVTIVTLYWYLILFALYYVANFIKTKNEFLASLVTYIPVLGMNGALAALPYILLPLSIRYERYKFDSQANLSLLKRYFAFYLVTLYALIFSGTILSEIHELILHPAEVLELLATALPLTSGYFIEIVACKLLLLLPLELSRALPLLRSWIKLIMAFYRSKSRHHNDTNVTRPIESMVSRRELRSPPFEPLSFRFSFLYPSVLVVVLVAFIFAPLCPIALPWCFVYFAAALYVYTMQFARIYVANYDAAGTFFLPALLRLVGGLAAGALSSAAYLASKLAFAPALACLILFIICSYNQHLLYDAYGSLTNQSLSLEDAARVDKEYPYSAQDEVPFNADEFVQPSLNSARCIPDLIPPPSISSNSIIYGASSPPASPIGASSSSFTPLISYIDRISSPRASGAGNNKSTMHFPRSP
mmetsp:Transcript_8773/g.12200  ORF Transcript_8773/g.12200 Transcript_8773/m.12200 type:complete len:871 (-) Transcript_8773:12-2624(-)